MHLEGVKVNFQVDDESHVSLDDTHVFASTYRGEAWA